MGGVSEASSVGPQFSFTDLSGKKRPIDSKLQGAVNKALEQIPEAVGKKRIHVQQLAEGTFKIDLGKGTVVHLIRKPPLAPEFELVPLRQAIVERGFLSSCSNFFRSVLCFFVPKAFNGAAGTQRSPRRAIREDYRELHESIVAGTCWMRARQFRRPETQEQARVRSEISELEANSRKVADALETKSPRRRLEKLVEQWKTQESLIVPFGYLNADGVLQPVLLRYTKDKEGGGGTIELFNDNPGAGEKIAPTIRWTLKNGANDLEKVLLLFIDHLTPLDPSLRARAVRPSTTFSSIFTAAIKDQCKKIEMEYPESRGEPKPSAPTGTVIYETILKQVDGMAGEEGSPVEDLVTPSRTAPGRVSKWFSFLTGAEPLDSSQKLGLLFSVTKDWADREIDSIGMRTPLEQQVRTYQRVLQQVRHTCEKIAAAVAGGDIAQAAVPKDLIDIEKLCEEKLSLLRPKLEAERCDLSGEPLSRTQKSDVRIPFETQLEDRQVESGKEIVIHRKKIEDLWAEALQNLSKIVGAEGKTQLQQGLGKKALRDLRTTYPGICLESSDEEIQKNPEQFVRAIANEIITQEFWEREKKNLFQNKDPSTRKQFIEILVQLVVFPNELPTARVEGVSSRIVENCISALWGLDPDKGSPSFARQFSLIRNLLQIRHFLRALPEVEGNVEELLGNLETGATGVSRAVESLMYAATATANLDQRQTLLLEAQDKALQALALLPPPGVSGEASVWSELSSAQRKVLANAVHDLMKAVWESQMKLAQTSPSGRMRFLMLKGQAISMALLRADLTESLADNPESPVLSELDSVTLDVEAVNILLSQDLTTQLSKERDLERDIAAVYRFAVRDTSPRAFLGDKGVDAVFNRYGFPLQFRAPIWKIHDPQVLSDPRCQQCLQQWFMYTSLCDPDFTLFSAHPTMGVPFFEAHPRLLLKSGRLSIDCSQEEETPVRVMSGEDCLVTIHPNGHKDFSFDEERASEYSEEDQRRIRKKKTALPVAVSIVPAGRVGGDLRTHASYSVWETYPVEARVGGQVPRFDLDVEQELNLVRQEAGMLQGFGGNFETNTSYLAVTPINALTFIANPNRLRHLEDPALRTFLSESLFGPFMLQQALCTSPFSIEAFIEALFAQYQKALDSNRPNVALFIKEVLTRISEHVDELSHSLEQDGVFSNYLHAAPVFLGIPGGALRPAIKMRYDVGQDILPLERLQEQLGRVSSQLRRGMSQSVWQVQPWLEEMGGVVRLDQVKDPKEFREAFCMCCSQYRRKALLEEEDVRRILTGYQVLCDHSLKSPDAERDAELLSWIRGTVLSQLEKDPPHNGLLTTIVNQELKRRGVPLIGEGTQWLRDELSPLKFRSVDNRITVDLSTMSVSDKSSDSALMQKEEYIPDEWLRRPEIQKALRTSSVKAIQTRKGQTTTYSWQYENQEFTLSICPPSVQLTRKIGEDTYTYKPISVPEVTSQAEAMVKDYGLWVCGEEARVFPQGMRLHGPYQSFSVGVKDGVITRLSTQTGELISGEATIDQPPLVPFASSSNTICLLDPKNKKPKEVRFRNSSLRLVRDKDHWLCYVGEKKVGPLASPPSMSDAERIFGADWHKIALYIGGENPSYVLLPYSLSLTPDGSVAIDQEVSQFPDPEIVEVKEGRVSGSVASRLYLAHKAVLEARSSVDELTARDLYDHASELLESLQTERPSADPEQLSAVRKVIIQIQNDTDFPHRLLSSSSALAMNLRLGLVVRRFQGMQRAELGGSPVQRFADAERMAKLYEAYQLLKKTKGVSVFRGEKYKRIYLLTMEEEAALSGVAAQLFHEIGTVASLESHLGSLSRLPGEASIPYFDHVDPDFMLTLIHSAHQVQEDASLKHKKKPLPLEDLLQNFWSYVRSIQRDDIGPEDLLFLFEPSMLPVAHSVDDDARMRRIDLQARQFLLSYASLQRLRRTASSEAKKEVDMARDAFVDAFSDSMLRDLGDLDPSLRKKAEEARDRASRLSFAPDQSGSLRALFERREQLERETYAKRRSSDITSLHDFLLQMGSRPAEVQSSFEKIQQKAVEVAKKVWQGEMTEEKALVSLRSKIPDFFGCIDVMSLKIDGTTVEDQFRALMHQPFNVKDVEDLFNKAQVYLLGILRDRQGLRDKIDALKTAFQTGGDINKVAEECFGTASVLSFSSADPLIGLKGQLLEIQSSLEGLQTELTKVKREAQSFVDEIKQEVDRLDAEYSGLKQKQEALEQEIQQLEESREEKDKDASFLQQVEAHRDQIRLLIEKQQEVLQKKAFYLQEHVTEPIHKTSLPRGMSLEVLRPTISSLTSMTETLKERLAELRGRTNGIDKLVQQNERGRELDTALQEALSSPFGPRPDLWFPEGKRARAALEAYLNKKITPAQMVREFVVSEGPVRGIHAALALRKQGQSQFSEQMELWAKPLVGMALVPHQIPLLQTISVGTRAGAQQPLSAEAELIRKYMPEEQAARLEGSLSDIDPATKDGVLQRVSESLEMSETRAAAQIELGANLDAVEKSFSRLSNKHELRDETSFSSKTFRTSDFDDVVREQYAVTAGRIQPGLKVGQELGKKLEERFGIEPLKDPSTRWWKDLEFIRKNPEIKPYITVLNQSQSEPSLIQRLSECRTGEQILEAIETVGVEVAEARDHRNVVQGLLRGVIPSESETLYAEDLRQSLKVLQDNNPLPSSRVLKRQNIQEMGTRIEDGIRALSGSVDQQKQEILKVIKEKPLSSLPREVQAIRLRKGGDEELLSEVCRQHRKGFFAATPDVLPLDEKILSFEIDQTRLEMLKQAKQTHEKLEKLDGEQKGLFGKLPNASEADRPKIEASIQALDRVYARESDRLKDSLTRCQSTFDLEHVDPALKPHLRKIVYLQWRTKIVLYKNQLDTLAEIVKNPSLLKQLRMGLGKTKVLLPFALEILGSKGFNSIGIVPRALFATNFQEMDEQTRVVFELAGSQFLFSRKSLSKPYSSLELHKVSQECRSFLEALERGEYVLTTIESKASLDDKMIEVERALSVLQRQYSQASEEKEKRGLLQKISDHQIALGLLSRVKQTFELENTRIVIDEADQVARADYAVNSEIGNKQALDPILCDTVAGVFTCIQTCKALEELKNAILSNSQIQIPLKPGEVDRWLQEIGRQWLLAHPNMYAKIQGKEQAVLTWLSGGECPLTPEEIKDFGPDLMQLKVLRRTLNRSFRSCLGLKVGLGTDFDQTHKAVGVPASQGMTSPTTKYSDPLMQLCLSSMISMYKNQGEEFLALQADGVFAELEEGEERRRLAAVLEERNSGKQVSFSALLSGNEEWQLGLRQRFARRVVSQGLVYVSQRQISRPVQHALRGCHLIALTGTATRNLSHLISEEGMRGVSEAGKATTAEVLYRLVKSSPQGLDTPVGTYSSDSKKALDELRECANKDSPYRFFVNQAGMCDSFSLEEIVQALHQQAGRPIIYLDKQKTVLINGEKILLEDVFPSEEKMRLLPEEQQSRIKDLQRRVNEEGFFYYHTPHARGTHFDIPTGAKGVVALSSTVNANDRDQAIYRARQLGEGHSVELRISEQQKEALRVEKGEDPVLRDVLKVNHDQTYQDEAEEDLAAYRLHLEGLLIHAVEDAKALLMVPVNESRSLDPESFAARASVRQMFESFFVQASDCDAYLRGLDRELFQGGEEKTKDHLLRQVKTQIRKAERLIEKLTELDPFPEQEKIVEKIRDAKQKLVEELRKIETQWESIAPQLPKTTPAAPALAETAESEAEEEQESEVATEAETQPKPQSSKAIGDVDVGRLESMDTMAIPFLSTLRDYPKLKDGGDIFFQPLWADTMLISRQLWAQVNLFHGEIFPLLRVYVHKPAEGNPVVSLLSPVEAQYYESVLVPKGNHVLAGTIYIPILSHDGTIKLVKESDGLGAEEVPLSDNDRLRMLLGILYLGQPLIEKQMSAIGAYVQTLEGKEREAIQKAFDERFGKSNPAFLERVRPYVYSA